MPEPSEIWSQFIHNQDGHQVWELTVGFPNFLMKFQGTPGAAGVAALGEGMPPLGTLNCSNGV